jgi:hypothetical protein
MSEYFLTPAGAVEFRPDPATVARSARAGVELLRSGRLCTACLVGTWPMTELRQHQTLCDTCRELDDLVSRLAGLDPVAGHHEAARATAHRDAVLRGVFLRARALGVVVLEERGAGLPPAELVPVGALREHGIVPGAPEDRVRRLARWIEAVDPGAHAARAHLLADVEALARAARASERSARRHEAWSDLGDVAADAARLPFALLDAVRRMVVPERSGR